jgi:MoaA/NifB/PqqE/SkfB family radical SAM enzyme
MSNVYCKSPWTGLFVQLNGQAKTCCSGAYVLGNLNTNSIENILTSSKIINIRQDILDGKIPSYCSYCKNVEIEVDQSQRQYFDQFELTDHVSTHYDLQTVDIRWNSLCNLNCVYCHEGRSTTWQQVKGIPIKPMYYDYYEELLVYLEQHKDRVNKLILAGGEPLLHKQNVQLLEQCRDDVVVDVITNLSIPLESSPVFRALANKQNVKWSVSMETLGQRFDYVRHGANWEQILKNLQELKKLDNHNVALLPLYCIYSATSVKEFAQFTQNLGVTVSWQKLVTPPYMDTNNFSEPIRNLAKQHIKSLLDQEYHMKFFQPLYQALDRPPRRTVDQKFVDWTSIYESRYSNQVGDFQRLWPELFEILENK